MGIIVSKTHKFKSTRTTHAPIVDVVRGVVEGGGGAPVGGPLGRRRGRVRPQVAVGGQRSVARAHAAVLGGSRYGC